jgi:hypothetical protein
VISTAGLKASVWGLTVILSVDAFPKTLWDLAYGRDLADARELVIL